MSVSLLMNFDGANGSTAFVDESANAFPITAAGNAQISTAQSKFGGSSVYFDGVGDYLSTPSNAAFALGAGDFTIEGWLYPTSFTLGSPFSKWGGSTPNSRSWAIYVGSGGSLSAYVSTDGQNFVETQLANSVVSLNTWQHVAFIRIGGFLKLFLDGVQRGATYNLGTTAIDIGSAKSLEIGATSLGTYAPFTGYVDAFRFVVGKALYTQNFTPPTAPPTIEYPLFNEFVNDHIVGQQATIMPLALTTPMNLPVWFTYDIDAGTFTLSGTVKEQGTPNAPLWRRVNLIEQVTGRVIREVWSDAATGEYSFPNIMGGRKYTVVSYDHTGYHRAVIADNLEPV